MYELAQVNIARLAAPLDDPRMQDFVEAFEPLKAAAAACDGYRWRLPSEGRDPRNATAFDDEIGDGSQVMTNLSTWRDPDSLHAYVFGPLHTQILRRRREWTLPIREVYGACWWVPAGYRPSILEARERVMLLRTAGPSAASFTLTTRFPSPASVSRRHRLLGTVSRAIGPRTARRLLGGYPLAAEPPERQRPLASSVAHVDQD